MKKIIILTAILSFSFSTFAERRRDSTFDDVTIRGKLTLAGGAISATNTVGELVYDVRTFGAIGGDAIDDTAAIRACANSIITNGRGGVMFFPGKGPYRMSGAVTNGPVGFSGGPGWWGYVTVRGDGNTKVIYSGTNGAPFYFRQMRYGRIEQIVLEGAGKDVGNTAGIMVMGPDGMFTVGPAVVAYGFNVGLYGDDITGMRVDRAAFYSNNVAIGVGHKPDDWQIDARCQYNVYGVWLGYTNLSLLNFFQPVTFTNRQSSLLAGNVKISGIQAYWERAAILVGGGYANIDNVYFETQWSGAAMAGVQIGYSPVTESGWRFPSSDRKISVSGCQFDVSVKPILSYTNASIRFYNTAGASVYSSNSVADTMIFSADQLVNYYYSDGVAGYNAHHAKRVSGASMFNINGANQGSSLQGHAYAVSAISDSASDYGNPFQAGWASLTSYRSNVLNQAAAAVKLRIIPGAGVPTLELTNVSLTMSACAASTPTNGVTFWVSNNVNGSSAVWARWTNGLDKAVVTFP